MEERKKIKIKRRDTVYINAYLGKKNSKEFFICKAKVIDLPTDRNPLYRVKILAVADRPIGGPPCEQQAALLGRVFSKKNNEVHPSLHKFLEPGGWIEIVKG